MMTIAYILNATNPFGGATKSFLALLNSMEGKDFHPIIVVPDNEGISQQLMGLGMEVHVESFRPNTYPWTGTPLDWLLFLPRLLARQWLNWRAARRLSHLFLNRHVSLVHTNVSVIDIGLRAARHIGVPHIYHFREYADLDFKMHYFPNKATMYRQLSHAGSYSICITQDIQRHHKLTGNPNSIVIYNGIRPQAVHKNYPPQRPYFLFVGRLEETKGLETLLEAYLTAKPTLPLLVAGETMRKEYQEKLLEFVRKHHLTQQVVFLGKRTDTDELMRNARALIVPSKFEAFGRCTAEGMFNGCLVIGRNTGGTKEQFDNGLKLTGHEIGWRFDSKEQLANHLQNALTISESEYDAITSRAFETVNKFYTIESYTTQVLSFYQHILVHRT